MVNANISVPYLALPELKKKNILIIIFLNIKIKKQKKRARETLFVTKPIDDYEPFKQDDTK